MIINNKYSIVFSDRWCPTLNCQSRANNNIEYFIDPFLRTIAIFIYSMKLFFNFAFIVFLPIYINIPLKSDRYMYQHVRRHCIFELLAMIFRISLYILKITISIPSSTWNWMNIVHELNMLMYWMFCNVGVWIIVKWWMHSIIPERLL